MQIKIVRRRMLVITPSSTLLLHVSKTFLKSCSRLTGKEAALLLTEITDTLNFLLPSAIRGDTGI